MKKEYVVISKPGIDIASIDADLLSNNSPEAHIPTESVEVVSARESNNRMTNYYLTDEEATALEEDPRILAVELEAKSSDFELYGELKGNFYRLQALDGRGTPGNKRQSWGYLNGNLGDGIPEREEDFVNWGLHRTSVSSNSSSLWKESIRDPRNFATQTFVEKGSIGSTGELAIESSMDGTGVDIVIMDGHMQVDHPDFLDAEGKSRVKLIDWYDYSPTNSTMPRRAYSGMHTSSMRHGTHVASLAAGLKHGWAKNAHIFSMPCIGTSITYGPSGNGFSVGQAYDLILSWHNTKNTPGHPLYTGRPTVVNMSFGASGGPSGHHFQSVTIRGVTTTLTPPDNPVDAYNDINGPNEVEEFDLYGLPPYRGSTRAMPLQSVQTDTGTQQLHDAGIVCVIAAGNSGDIQHKTTHPDYNNSARFLGSNTDRFFHRHNSPHVDEVITVGNLSSTMYTENYYDSIVGSSVLGSRVDILAPGTMTLAAMSSPNSNSEVQDKNFTYWYDEEDPVRFIEKSITGTSMSSPMVAGVAALHLQAKPKATPAQIKARILADASEPELYIPEYTLNALGVKPVYSPTNYGRGSAAGDSHETDGPLHPSWASRGILQVTTGKVLFNRYANKQPLELSGDVTLSETPTQITAPDYYAHSVIDTNNVNSFSSYPTSIITAFLRVHTDATTHATKSVGDVKFSATNAITLGTACDHGNGTYSVQLAPITQLITADQNMTISAFLRDHDSSEYKAIANTHTVNLTPANVVIQGGPFHLSSQVPRQQVRYATDGDFGVESRVRLLNMDFGGQLVSNGSPGILSNFDSSSLISPVESYNSFALMKDYYNGEYHWTVPDPAEAGTFPFTYKTKDGNLVDALGFTQKYEENQDFEANTIIEVHPPVVPNDGNALQTYRVIPFNDDGTPTLTHVGVPSYSFGSTSGLSFETFSDERIDGAETANRKETTYDAEDAVIYKRAASSTNVKNQTGTITRYTRSQDLLNGITAVGAYNRLTNNNFQIQFSSDENCARAYYTTLDIINPLTAQEDNYIRILATLKNSENSFIVDDTMIITIKTNTSDTIHTLNYSPERSTDGLASRYVVDIPFENLVTLKVTGTLNDFVMNEQVELTSSGQNYSLFSELSVDPELIQGTETATVTLQIKGDSNTLITESVGSVSFSTSDDSEVLDTTDNNDGTYTGTYHPMNVDNSSKTSIISAAINLQPATSTATVTSGPSNFWQFSTLSVESTTINQFTATDVFLTVRKRDGAPYAFSVGNTQIQTTKGSISPTVDLGNGTYKATLTTNGEAGLAELSASIHGFVTVDKVSVTLDLEEADYIQNSTVTPSLSTLTANGEDHSIVTIQMKKSATENETSSLGPITVSPSVGKIPGDIVDNANGSYTFRYEAPLSLTTLTEDFVVTLANVGKFFTRESVITCSGVLEIKQDFTATLDATTDEDGLLVAVRGQGLVLPPEERGLYIVPPEDFYLGHLSTCQYLPLPGWYTSGFSITNPEGFMGRPSSLQREIVGLLLSSWGHDGEQQLWTETSNANIASIRVNDKLPFSYSDASHTVYGIGNEVVVQWVHEVPSGDWDEEYEGVYIPGDAQRGDTVNVKVTAPTSTNIQYTTHSTLETNTPSITGNGTDSAEIILRLKTSPTNFATVSGGPVTFSTTLGTISNVTDNENGTYTATLTGVTDGTAIISARINGLLVNDTASVSILNATAGLGEYLTLSQVVFPPDDGSPGVATFESLFGDNFSTLTVQVRLKDSNGFASQSVGTVVITCSDSAIVVGPVTDNLDGTYNAEIGAYHHRDITTQTNVVTLSATLEGQDIANTASLNTTDPNWAYASTVSLDPSSITTFGTSEITIQAKRQDGVSTPTSAGTMSFDAYSGVLGEVPTISSVVDNNDGTYTATLTPGTVAYGSLPVTPKIDGNAFSNPGTLVISSSITALRQNSVITSQSSSLIANGTTQTTVELQLKSAPSTNYNVSGGTVVFSTTLGSIGSVTDHGDGTYTAVYTSASSAGTAVISATLDGGAVTDTHSITLQSGSFSEQFVVTTGLLDFDPNDYIGFYYLSSQGVYSTGSVDDNSFAPASGYHVKYMVSIPVVSGSEIKYALQMGLSDVEVGGQSTNIPSNAVETSWNTLRIGTTTYSRTNASYSGIAGTAGYTWNISSPNPTVNPWGSIQAGQTVTVTFDPSN